MYITVLMIKSQFFFGERIILRMKVLFVCTGNTCRSPMAAGYLAHLCRINGMDHSGITSAGIAAPEGQCANPKACRTAAEYGFDLTAHTSRTAAVDMLKEQDLIIVLSRSHQTALLQIAPETAGKIHLLLEFSPAKGGDVADPFGGTMETYRTCFEQMKQPIEEIFKNFFNRTKQ